MFYNYYADSVSLDFWYLLTAIIGGLSLIIFIDGSGLNKEKRIPVFAKIDRRKLLQKAQITPGTKPQRAVTAIVIIESR